MAKIILGDDIMLIDNEIYENLRSTASDSNDTENNSQTSDIKKSFHMWLYGMIMSFIPLISLPLFLVFTSKFSEISDSLLKIFGSPAIMFMAVSLTVTSTNDNMSDYYGSNKRSVKINIIWIVISTIFYCIMNIAEYIAKDSYNIKFAVILNFIFLIVTLVLGLASYKRT